MPHPNDHTTPQNPTQAEVRNEYRERQAYLTALYDQAPNPDIDVRAACLQYDTLNSYIDLCNMRLAASRAESYLLQNRATPKALEMLRQAQRQAESKIANIATTRICCELHDDDDETSRAVLSPLYWAYVSQDIHGWICQALSIERNEIHKHVNSLKQFQGEIDPAYYPDMFGIDGTWVFKGVDIGDDWTTDIERPQDWIAWFGQTPTEGVQELRTMPYAEYLASSHWQMKRTEALAAAGYRCQVCNSSTHLHVHHRTYERRGAEELSDLTVLCEVCHRLFHQHGRLHGGDE